MHPHANPLVADAVDRLEHEPDDDQPRQVTFEELQEEHRQEHERQRRAAHADLDRVFDEVWLKSCAQMEGIFRELDGQRPS